MQQFALSEETLVELANAHIDSRQREKEILQKKTISLLKLNELKIGKQ